MTAGTVYAAGGVVWRVVDGKLRILMVHRTRYRDITLPKGKVDPGETLPETAVREIREETGVRVHLGTPVGVSLYHLPTGREKVVHYWAAEATDAAIRASSFVPNREIAALEWAGLKKARRRLSYPVDVEILDAFVARVDAGDLRTFPVIVLRHAKARTREEWDGADADRPLATRGRRQAQAIVGPLQAFGPRRIVSSPAERCVRTVTPLSASLARRIERAPLLSQDAWEQGRSDVRSVVGERVRSRKPAVVCGHGPVLPDLVTELELATGTVPGTFPPGASSLDPAAFVVAHVSVEHPGAGIVATELHDPAM